MPQRKPKADVPDETPETEQAAALKQLTDATVESGKSIDKLGRALRGESLEEPVELPKPTPIRGYRPIARWVKKTAAPYGDPGDGWEPLWIECNVAGLTLNDIRWMLNDAGNWIELWDFMAPRIRAWNAVAYDHASKADVIAPAPSEVGSNAFAIVGLDTSSVCRLLLCNAVLEGPDGRDDEKKESASSPATKNASA